MSRTCRWRAILFASVCCAACGTPSATTAPTNEFAAFRPNIASSTITMSGRVLEYSTGAAIAGTSVAFGQVGNQFVASAAAVTDASGTYRITVPAARSYSVAADGAIVGTIRPAASIRGDVFVRFGTCIARYGSITDATTGMPIAGAVVSLAGQTATTGTDGWYRIDFGCPTSAPSGGTTFFYVSHPGYLNQTQVAGRGIASVQRADISMTIRGVVFNP